jgi:hypothetical protein
MEVLAKELAPLQRCAADGGLLPQVWALSVYSSLDFVHWPSTCVAAAQAGTEIGPLGGGGGTCQSVYPSMITPKAVVSAMCRSPLLCPCHSTRASSPLWICLSVRILARYLHLHVTAGHNRLSVCMQPLVATVCDGLYGILTSSQEPTEFQETVCQKRWHTAIASDPYC